MYFVTGDLEAARQTQIAFLKNLEETVDGTPLLGHAKAAIHCAAGELEKCKVNTSLYIYRSFTKQQFITIVYLFLTQEVALKATRPVFAVAGGVAGGIYRTFHVIISSNCNKKFLRFTHANE